MSDPRIKILLAEDDPNLGFLLLKYLKKEGFDVELYKNGEDAFSAFKNISFDLCLIDVMMPKMDGFSLVKRIRARDKKTPVILITAKSRKENKQNGYELGADDYLIKPFDEEELLWKIKVFVRRNPNSPERKAKAVSIGRYTFDFNNQSLTIEGKAKRITGKESDVLHYLCQHSNVIIKREEMLKELWGESDYFLGRSLDVFITKIRKHLKEDSSIRIENVFGIGFIFNTNKTQGLKGKSLTGLEFGSD